MGVLEMNKIIFEYYYGIPHLKRAAGRSDSCGKMTILISVLPASK